MLIMAHDASPPHTPTCSSVLPLPYAFSRLGILPGLGIMLAVAGANALAGTLLLRAAGALRMHSFEGLAEAVGGRSWRVRAPAQQAAPSQSAPWNAGSAGTCQGCMAWHTQAALVAAASAWLHSRQSGCLAAPVLPHAGFAPDPSS